MKQTLSGFMAALALTATILHGQTFQVLHSFNGNDGTQVQGGLVVSNRMLYGTTKVGGTYSWGTVYAVSTSGSNFTTLYNFSGLYSGEGVDGGTPYGSLVLSGGTLYGMASQGGVNASGTVFAVATNGSDSNIVVTALHAFSAPSSTYPLWINAEGAAPAAALILSGNTLYGTTFTGGTNGNGTVFSVNTNGGNFKVLHSFGATAGTLVTNADGANSVAGLVLSGGELFGTTYGGGGNGVGVVFSVETNGDNFKVLHTFSATNTAGYNLDGANPEDGLVLSDGALYGTTLYGGTNGLGTVFSLDTNSGVFSVLRAFTIAGYENGADPYGGLLLSDGQLYGTTLYGGSYGNGNIFLMSTNGSGFTNLYSFSGGDDGSFPYGTLAMSGKTLYGTTYGGGSNGDYGVVFSLQLASSPSLAITGIVRNSDGSVTLTVLSPAESSTRLLAATNLAPPIVWLPISTNTAGTDGSWQFTDTKAGNYPVRYYRAVTP